MEFKMDQIAIPDKISFNYEELKRELSEKVRVYETLVYTDDQIKTAKADRADLNRLKKALNDERIRLEKDYMRPLNDLKIKINEIIGIIDKPVLLIDKQIKSYEDEQKKQKKEKIEEYFNVCPIPIPTWFSLPMIWDEKWLNVSMPMKSIQEQINAKVAAVNSDLAALSELPEFSFEAIETYKTTLDLNQAIAEGHRLSEMQKRKAEQERMKAEQERLQKWQEKERELSTEDITKEEIAQSKKDYMEAANTGGAHMSPELSKQWVSFQAFLGMEDAKALAEFFKSRNIEFKRI